MRIAEVLGNATDENGHTAYMDGKALLCLRPGFDIKMNVLNWVSLHSAYL